jgi:hypothetical protein
MSYFVQATEYDMSLNAKIQDLMFHGLLYLNTSKFDFLEFSTRQ